MLDPDLREKAVTIRLKRMRSELAWSAFGATFIELVLRQALFGREISGLNLLVFGLLSIAVYFGLRGKVAQLDTSSFVWRMKWPWRLVYWPVAAVLIALLQADRTMAVAAVATIAIFVAGSMTGLYFEERYSWKGGGIEGLIAVCAVILAGLGIFYVFVRFGLS